VNRSITRTATCAVIGAALLAPAAAQAAPPKKLTAGVGPGFTITLKNAAAADALRTRLDAAAKEVAPGARAPFVVYFYDHPSDMGSFRLEVTFESQAQVAGNAQP